LPDRLDGKALGGNSLPACDFFFQGREPAPVHPVCDECPRLGRISGRAFFRSRPEIEVQAVRTLLGVTIVAVCLTPAGCTTPARKGGTDNARANNTPFMGTPSADASAATPPPDAPPGSGANLASGGPSPNKKSSVLAGRILDEYSRLKPKAIIEVIDLDAPRDAVAPLKVLANKDGYFDIDGMQGGHNYRLVASVKEGARVLTGTTRVVAPNVHVVITLNEERPITDPPGGSNTRPASADVAGGGPVGPAASIGAPIRSPGEGVTTPLPGGDNSASGGGTTVPVVPPPVSTGDPSLIADKGKKDGVDGFSRGVPANIQGPGREPGPPKGAPTPVTPPASSDGGDGGMTTPLPPSAAPSAAPPTPAGSADAGVAGAAPFCRKTGNQVENFALVDTDGKPWELRKQTTGRVVLLDFWFSGCAPCRKAIPHLIELQQKYGQFGLQIVAIARESGTLAEKQQAIRGVRARYDINYTLLFSGGGDGPCPVLKSFDVQEFPTLVLLDNSGKIVFRTKKGQGLDEWAAYYLELEIRRQLKLPLTR
jgi:thiol-disulfide isomerase/thioredoxin